jgi:phosphopantothenoylcysteine decarboxylase/phosphopantothenate--cysteine ligase
MQNGFTGKKIVLGITGSIAAFKVAGWVSTLAKEGADVTVVMTEAAGRFVTPLTFAALSGNPVFAKLAHGMADDLLSTTVLAAACPVLVAPAMNSRMLENPATQRNMELLKRLGHSIIEPEFGKMACKTEGPGRLPEWEDVQEQLLAVLSDQDLAGEKILITAGPTREALDPARFLSNRSSGKMGYALARTAKRRGAEVLLISGPTTLPTPYGVKRINIQTAEEMYAAVMDACSDASVIIKAAAVSDFRPETTTSEKVKKEDAEFILKLQQTNDILKHLGQEKEKNGYLLVGFAAESSNLQAAGTKKLQEKNLDLIAINDISSSNTGFEADTNQVTLLDKSGFTELPLVSKEQTANLILDRIGKLLIPDT